MNYKECAQLIQKVALEFGDERAAKCGYDLFNGMANGTIKKRIKAWENYLREGKNGSHTDEQRDGVWVPAVFIN